MAETPISIRDTVALQQARDQKRVVEKKTEKEHIFAENQELSAKAKAAGKIILRFLKKQIQKKEAIISTIQWMTGSNGRSLPFLKYTGNKLIPTGLLSDQRIAPFAGELGAGVAINGVNQTWLSGTKDFTTAWGRYAKAHYHKTLSLEELDRSVFDKMNEVFEYEFKIFEESQMADLNLAERFARYILQMRQLNETKYQKEYVETGKIAKLQSIIRRDECFFILSDRKQIAEAFRLEIPPDVKPEPSRDCAGMVELLKTNGFDKDIKAIKKHFDIEKFSKFAAMAAGLKGCLATESDIYGTVFGERQLGKGLAFCIAFVKAIDADYVAERQKDVMDFMDRFVGLFQRSRRRLLSAINEGPLFRVSETERKEMADLSTAPIVFSTTKPIRQVPPDIGGEPDEILHEGELRFDLIITDRDNQNKVKQYLAQKGLPEQAARVCTDAQVKRVLALQSRIRI